MWRSAVPARVGRHIFPEALDEDTMLHGQRSGYSAQQPEHLTHNAWQHPGIAILSHEEAAPAAWWPVVSHKPPEKSPYILPSRQGNAIGRILRSHPQQKTRMASCTFFRLVNCTAVPIFEESSCYLFLSFVEIRGILSKLRLYDNPDEKCATGRFQFLHCLLTRENHK